MAGAVNSEWSPKGQAPHLAALFKSDAAAGCTTLVIASVTCMPWLICCAVCQVVMMDILRSVGRNGMFTNSSRIQSALHPRFCRPDSLGLLQIAIQKTILACLGRWTTCLGWSRAGGVLTSDEMAQAAPWNMALGKATSDESLPPTETWKPHLELGSMRGQCGNCSTKRREAGSCCCCLGTHLQVILESDSVRVFAVVKADSCLLPQVELLALCLLGVGYGFM
ncbi:hypothetical protein QBC43DRAFT_105809 [Cladorrhinum sp. PSN259]|nr:hypothetical protein QBC43DRAFT_105809 [Cladorrhinum sp. PSN259]